MHFEKVLAGFSRYHKYPLGTELRNKSREVVGQIVKANSTRETRANHRSVNEITLATRLALLRKTDPESLAARLALLGTNGELSRF